jgi:hypothetical protein
MNPRNQQLPFNDSVLNQNIALVEVTANVERDPLRIVIVHDEYLSSRLYNEAN